MRERTATYEENDIEGDEDGDTDGYDEVRAATRNLHAAVTT